MTRLSVNLNKVALLRNARDTGVPSVLAAAGTCIRCGAHGITVHPRPDGRHILARDVHELAAAIREHPDVELNVEGNPFPEFVALARQVRPAQCTLVPDSVDTRTSDHGWDLRRDGQRLAPIIEELRSLQIRVSLFMDADSNEWERVSELGADRVELYTGPYAAAFARSGASLLPAFAAAAARAQAAGLGVNAGHDLNRANLAAFCSIPGILEVSIGHALIADALDMSLTGAVRAYLDILYASERESGKVKE